MLKSNNLKLTGNDLNYDLKYSSREREKLIDNLRNRKAAFQPGVWNADTVLLGGLGKDPELDEKEDPIKVLKKSFEKSIEKTKKINLFGQNMAQTEDNFK